MTFSPILALRLRPTATFAQRFVLRIACLPCVFLALALGTGACSKKDAPPKAASSEKRYPLKGEVVKVDAANNILTIKHEEIAGLMPAMVMEFTVSSGDAVNAKVGQQVRAELVTEGKGDFRLEKLWVADPSKDSAVAAASKALIQDTVARGNGAYREVGEKAPDFALYDQDGKVVESTRFRGKKVLLNFIFTRCPVANMCPAAVARFQQTQRLAREGGINDLELISISLDPTYDTPGILKSYVTSRGLDTSNYTLLTGPENAIKSLLSQFGVIANFEGELLKHTLSTVLIDPQGRILHRVDGSTWEPEEFISKIKKG